MAEEALRREAAHGWEQHLEALTEVLLERRARQVREEHQAHRKGVVILRTHREQEVRHLVEERTQEAECP